MLLNWCCSLNIFNVEKSVVGNVKKSITSSFFNRVTFQSAVRCTTFQKINVETLKLKFQTVSEKTAKNFRGLLYFAAPGILRICLTEFGCFVQYLDVDKNGRKCENNLLVVVACHDYICLLVFMLFNFWLIELWQQRLQTDDDGDERMNFNVA